VTRTRRYRSSSSGVVDCVVQRVRIAVRRRDRLGGILHEYDHIEGKLFIDYLKPLKRKLLKSKLDDITRGRIKVDYKMSFPK